ncbi:hypothetical protein [Paludisphaera rhizosphaerae]|uniref:hypothetical protein n=1 Tax=Paludisphaera rhizosphaerae TaxID=2711216 RepID=UPI0013EC3712|nr:hypothetical protein [Paludisphaera rhizosphaerae]
MSNSIVAQQVWMPAFIGNLHSVNVGLNFVDDSPVVVSAGSAKILSAGSITAGSYTPGTDFTLMDATVTGNTLTLDQKPYWAVGIDNVEEVQTNPQAVANLTREGAYGISASIDAYLLGRYTSAITANKLTASAGAAIDMSSVAIYTKIVAAGTALTKAGAPMSGRWIVVSPETHARLLQDTTYFVRASALGDMVVTSARFGTTVSTTPGFVGQIAGFDVFVSNNLTTASAGANAYLVYGQGKPIHFASQLGEVKVAEASKQFGSIIKQLVVFGAAVLGPNTGRIGSIYVVNA